MTNDEICAYHKSFEGYHTKRYAKYPTRLNDGSTIHKQWYYVFFTSGNYGFDMGETYCRKLPSYRSNTTYIELPQPIRIRNYENNNIGYLPRKLPHGNKDYSTVTAWKAVIWVGTVFLLLGLITGVL